MPAALPGAFGPYWVEDKYFSALPIKALHHCFDEFSLCQHKSQTLLPAEGAPSAPLSKARLTHLIPHHITFLVTLVITDLL